MPFIAIELGGAVTREQRALVVGDVTRSMVERLGKPAAAVQVVINEHSTSHYGAGGQLLADRDATPPVREDARADVGQ